MDKKNNAIFSVKMNSRNANKFNSDVHIEGDTSCILSCLKAGLIKLLRCGIHKSVLREVLEAACDESKKEDRA